MKQDPALLSLTIKQKKKQRILLKPADTALNFTMNGRGGFGVFFLLGEKKYQFLTDYQNHPLEALLKALISINPDFGNRRLPKKRKKGEYRTIPVKQTSLTWYGDPWFYNWTFRIKKDNLLKIKIEEGPDWENTPEQTTPVIKFYCRYDDFVRLGVDAALQTLHDYGFAGYSQNLIPGINYPLVQLFQLASYLYPNQHLAVQEFEDKACASHFEKELEWLMQNSSQIKQPSATP